MDAAVLHQGIFFALQEPQFITNPYPLYRRLRSEAPFYWDFLLPGWFLTRYADVQAALADQRLTNKNFPFDVTQLPHDLQNDLAPFERVINKAVFHNESSEHDRLRRPVNRALNTATLEALRPGMEALAQKLLANAERNRSMEVVKDYSEPLADYMIGELLGLPLADRATFIKWCDDFRNFMMSQRTGRETILKAKVAVKSFERLRAYVRTRIAIRREKFADDVIGRSLAVEPEETPPSEDEFLANCVLFLHTGVRNMSAAITNAVLALLQHPKQFARLREDPASITLAVEELLRYETPIQVSIRGVREEMEFAGWRVRPKQLLVLLLGAANRDPKQFADPDRVDLTRRPNHHLSFGVGPHGCVGRWLARFGLVIAIGAILHRQSRLRLAPGKLQWYPPAMRRTVRALPTVVDRRLRRHRRGVSSIADSLAFNSTHAKKALASAR
jgi:pimeloyl-[acyl-carrier protein] synthase